MPSDKELLERLRSQLQPLASRRSGFLQLGRALAGPSGTGERQACEACLEALHEYVEAELNGQPVRRRFPEVACHLDVCQDCEQVYVTLLETALEAEAKPMEVPLPELALDLSFLPALELAGQLRSVVQILAEGVLRRLHPELLADLPRISQQFFRRIGQIGESLHVLPEPALALGLGPGLPPVPESLLASYLATVEMLHSLTDKQLESLLDPSVPSTQLEGRARSAAIRAGMRRRDAIRWAREYVIQSRAHADVLTSLARQLPKDERSA